MTSSLSHYGIATSLSVGELLSQFERGEAPKGDRARFATDMRPLDEALGGGFSRQELVLLAGRPGVGKTIAALQWARSCARAGRVTTYLCFEHSPRALLARLFALELAACARPQHLPAVDRLVRRLQDTVASGSGFDELLLDPLAAHAYEEMRQYSGRLQFVEASGRGTDVDAIEKLVATTGPDALFVDYLQKIPVRDAADDAEHNVQRVERLKDLAIESGIVVVAVAAGDRDALRERRMRMHHLRGASALSYEADTIIMLNDKAVAVSRSHLAYDSVRAESYRKQVVFSIEKHRSGPAGLDIEFTKDIAHYRFEPDGAFVAENLVDEVLYLD
jgi:replicative DNA helicase